jgi:predicted N-formylglutamate amidohydrolase
VHRFLDMAVRSYHLLFTCEHASNAIPASFREVGQRAGAALETHRGYDPGSLDLGRYLAKTFAAPLLAGRCSRLLVELNRSLRHPALWSEFSRPLAPARKKALLDGYYTPYRQAVERNVRRAVDQGRTVIHLSIHTFTPVWKGQLRTADVGLLYDPGRSREKELCARWKAALAPLAPAWRVRFNYPYRGVADGLVTHLRKRFPSRNYVGIELELNQAFPLAGGRSWQEAKARLASTLKEVLARRTFGPVTANSRIS